MPEIPTCSAATHLSKIKNTRGKILVQLQKSVNLQYNTLVRWDAGTKDSSTKRLMFQAFFSLFLIDLGHSELFIFMIQKIKNKLKGFLQRILQDFRKNIILGT